MKLESFELWLVGKQLFWDERNLFGKVFFLWAWLVVLVMFILEAFLELTKKHPKTT